jgi:hypothetical protein
VALLVAAWAWPPASRACAGACPAEVGRPGTNEEDVQGFAWLPTETSLPRSLARNLGHIDPSGKKGQGMMTCA